MDNVDHNLAALQTLFQEVQSLQQRMDFFEGVMLQLLVGLKDAGIIVDEEDEAGEEETSILSIE